MGPRGFGYVLAVMAALFFVQALTLGINALLPRHWPATRRWILAILLPPLTLGIVAVLIALLA